jgi:hypothetical protein
VNITVSDASGSDTETVTINVHAVDQQPFSQGENSLSVGNNHRIAQTLTVGATGRLTAIRFFNLKCETPTLFTVRLVGVNPASGEPDENKEFGTSTFTAPGQIVPIPSTPFFTVDQRLALVLSANNACTIANLGTFDNYAGDHSSRTQR